MRPRLHVLLPFLGLLVLGAGCRACAGKTVAPAAPVIRVDGEIDEPAWAGATRTGPFLDADGHPSAPYSDARFLLQPDGLYVALYAGDENITRDDHFTVHIGDRDFRFGPADKRSEVGIDMDGTLDDPADDDEEWVIETRIPYTELPHGLTALTVERCDTPRNARAPSCASGRLRLELP
jgi:hypothetical protein